jgi:hypothetical protein
MLKHNKHHLKICSYNNNNLIQVEDNYKLCP